MSKGNRGSGYEKNTGAGKGKHTRKSQVARERASYEKQVRKEARKFKAEQRRERLREKFRKLRDFPPPGGRY
jgi:hypothetical protein